MAYVAIPLPQDEIETRREVSMRFHQAVFALTGRALPPLISQRDELRLVRRFQRDPDSKDGQKAIEELSRRFSPFLRSIVHKVCASSGDMHIAEDMLCEACAAFVHAVGRYDTQDAPARLATYARYHVAGEVMTFQMRQARSVTFGTNVNDRKAFYALPELKSDFAELMGRAPNFESVVDVAWMERRSGIPAINLKRAASRIDASTFASIDEMEVYDTDQLDPELEAMGRDGMKAVARALAHHLPTLSHRDQEIVTELIANPEIDKGVLAERHGLTRERIGQIWRFSLNVVRHDLSRAGITCSEDCVYSRI